MPKFRPEGKESQFDIRVTNSKTNNIHSWSNTIKWINEMQIVHVQEAIWPHIMNMTIKKNLPLTFIKHLNLKIHDKNWKHRQTDRWVDKWQMDRQTVRSTVDPWPVQEQPGQCLSNHIIICHIWSELFYYLAISICSFLAVGSFISCNTESKYRTARWVWYFSFWN